MKIQPVIKWSGSKRTQSEFIISKFPNSVERYYEPFVGGGSVIFQLLNNKDIKVYDGYWCSDINQDLINLWIDIKENPYSLADAYDFMWNELNKDSNIDRKKEYYNSVRARVNKEHKPEDFLFISRTTVNGLIRYNNSGNLNNSFHLTRNGIEPKTLEKILVKWSNLLVYNGVKFTCQSYDKIETNDADFIYLDPPYFATKGMYNGVIDYEKFWNWCRSQQADYIISFDGKTNKEDYTYEVPKDIYKKHEYVFAGNSSFRRIIGKSLDTTVSESIYMKY